MFQNSVLKFLSESFNMEHEFFKIFEQRVIEDKKFFEDKLSLVQVN